MSPADLKALQQLHRLMRELETDSRDGAFAEAKLLEVQSLLESFAGHEIFEFQKLSEISPHLIPTMSMKHYVAWIVPVERLLQKELRDDEFLIFSQDKVASTSNPLPLVFILDNLRSAFNVGSIFRTAECFGVQKIYLCGYTPLPTQTKLLKTAMGTDQWVAWEEAPSLENLLAQLKNSYQIVAFETTSHAKLLTDPFAANPTAFVFGNERFGLEASALNICQEVRKIPLRGQKNSLNVGVAAAIATYEFARQFAGGQR